MTRAGWTCPDDPVLERVLNGISGPNRVPSWWTDQEMAAVDLVAEDLPDLEILEMDARPVYEPPPPNGAN
ncbi:hypothetical protein [Deinococcus sonorensis]|uniref:Uncharacterized protein n=2 Tax=Deinococcus sonorensis TaxID=309891 RepID=A0AAU7UGL4_9DEIO